MDACKLLRIALSAVETTSWSRATIRAAVDVIASTHFCVLVTRASGSGLVPVLTRPAPGLNRSWRKGAPPRGGSAGPSGKDSPPRPVKPGRRPSQYQQQVRQEPAA